ncbi:helix-turn-helix domain-containing protein [Streptomyces sp. PmtG]
MSQGQRPDGDGDDGGYAERPSPLLPGAVVWTKTAGPPGVAPVLPDGCVDLLWNEGRLFVAGPDTRAYTPGPETAGRFVGVRFAPGTGPAVLGVPADELRDRRVDLAELWRGPEVRAVAARVDEAADPMAALERVASDRAGRGPGPDPLLARVVALLDAGLDVAATAAAVGLGTRQLHRRSLPAFGYGPKTLARVLRLRRALALARGGLGPAATAAAAGFADQAHLARDVKEFTGVPLGVLLRGP